MINTGTGWVQVTMNSAATRRAHFTSVTKTHCKLNLTTIIGLLDLIDECILADIAVVALIVHITYAIGCTPSPPFENKRPARKKKPVV